MASPVDALIPAEDRIRPSIRKALEDAGDMPDLQGEALLTFMAAEYGPDSILSPTVARYYQQQAREEKHYR
jgi:hypothetical protein